MLPINMGVEKINEEYGFEFGLRDEFEYSPYEHSIVFSAVNRQQLQKSLQASLCLCIWPINSSNKKLNKNR